MSRPHKLLISFHYARNLDFAAWIRDNFTERPMVFADSGAFSAQSQNAPIDVGEYAAWLDRHVSCFEVYANLDVIRDPIRTAQNQAYLERRGHRPLPVFHTGTPWIVLEGLMERYDYIALGGCVGYRAKQLMPWIARAYRLAEKAKHRVVFHGFGLTQAEIIRSFPWYSVDSSSWGSSYRYGALTLFDMTKGQFVKVKMFDQREVAAVRRLIEAHGARPEWFMNRADYHHSKAAGASAVAYHRLEQWLRRRFGNVDPPELHYREAVSGGGPHVYLASAGGNFYPGERLEEIKVAAIRASGPHVYLADTNPDILAIAAKAKEKFDDQR
jgi:hypothetical protein